MCWSIHNMDLSFNALLDTQRFVEMKSGYLGMNAICARDGRILHSCINGTMITLQTSRSSAKVMKQHFGHPSIHSNRKMSN